MGLRLGFGLGSALTRPPSSVSRDAMASAAHFSSARSSRRQIASAALSSANSDLPVCGTHVRYRVWLGQHTWVGPRFGLGQG